MTGSASKLLLGLIVLGMFILVGAISIYNHNILLSMESDETARPQQAQNQEQADLVPGDSRPRPIVIDSRNDPLAPVNPPKTQITQSDSSKSKKTVSRQYEQPIKSPVLIQ